MGAIEFLLLIMTFLSSAMCLIFVTSKDDSHESLDSRYYDMIKEELNYISELYRYKEQFIKENKCIKSINCEIELRELIVKKMSKRIK